MLQCNYTSIWKSLLLSIVILHHSNVIVRPGEELTRSGAWSLLGTDLLSLFGEQPLRELDALLELGHLFQMSVFPLRHPIVEPFDQLRIDEWSEQATIRVGAMSETMWTIIRFMSGPLRVLLLQALPP